MNKKRIENNSFKSNLENLYRKRYVESRQTRKKRIKDVLFKGVLENLYIEKNMSDREIGKIYSCSDVSISNLRKEYNIQTKTQYKRLLDNKNEKYVNVDIMDNASFLKEYLNSTLEEFARKCGCSTLKIKNERKRRKLLSKEFLRKEAIPEPSYHQKIVFIGSTLGDGGIYRSSKETSYFKEGHSINQDLYLKKKHLDLLPFSNKLNYYNNEIGENEIYFKTTPTLYLDNLRKIFYINGKKELPLNFLIENWDSGYLVYWFFDDGSLKDNQFQIDTGFSKNLDELCYFINKNTKLDVRLSYNSKIKMSKIAIKNRSEFFTLLQKYITPDMLYKIPEEFYKHIDKNLFKELHKRSLLGYGNDIKKYKAKIYHTLNESDQDSWIDSIFNYYRIHGFPYITFSNSKLKDRLLNFSKGSIEEKKGVLEFKTMGLDICKHFMPNIYKARNNNSKKSPLDMWENDVELKNLIRNRFRYATGVTPACMRTGCDLLYRTVSNFKPLIAKWICDNYGYNQRLYLPDAGYGGKLLGAIFSKKHTNIICLEPNTETATNLQTMAKDIPNSKKIEILQNGAENYCPEKLKGKIGLILSCPPYFDLEIYSQEDSQSIQKYPTYENWKVNYFHKYLDNVRELLHKDGHFAIVLGNTDKYNLIKELFDYLSGKLGLIAEYQVPLGKVFDKRSTQEIFKFEKLYIFKKQGFNSVAPDLNFLKKKIITSKRNFLQVDLKNTSKTIKELHDKGINLSRTNLNDNPKLFPYSTSSIENYFKSWNNFLEYSGVPLNYKASSSKEKMIEYRKYCLKYRKVLSFYELEKLENIPATRYKRLFGISKPYFHLKDTYKNYILVSDEAFTKWIDDNFEN